MPDHPVRLRRIDLVDERIAVQLSYQGADHSPTRSGSPRRIRNGIYTLNARLSAVTRNEIARRLSPVLAPPWRAYIGMLLVGWGAFNLVEGLIDHQLLGIHHVRDDLGAPLGWDLAFLGLGVILIVVGVALARSGERAARERVTRRVPRAA